MNELINPIGKLAKLAGVPVVIMICHGDHLNAPHYNQHPARKTTYEIEFKCIVNENELKTLTAQEIQDRIEKEFQFDEYQWQWDNKVQVKSKYRAHNLHRILYKCPHCGKDYSMRSQYTKLWCKECGVSYEMNEYGRLECQNNEAKFVHVPDWYRWERKMVEDEVKSGAYSFKDTVRIEHLENSKVGLKCLGNVEFTQDMNGIHLRGKLDNGEDFSFDKKPLDSPSIHVEYDFKKKGTVKQGQAIDINTLTDTWFIYPKTENCVLTKIHLATEALYDISKK